MCWTQRYTQLISSTCGTSISVQIVGSTILNGGAPSDYLAMLRRLCGRFAILPPSHVISDGLKITTLAPVESGGFADVYRGTYNGNTVAVKVFRPCAISQLAKMRKVSSLGPTV